MNPNRRQKEFNRCTPSVRPNIILKGIKLIFVGKVVGILGKIGT